jgi:hypothetical protein
VDSVEQAIFMVPHIDDPLHNSDFDHRLALFWIHAMVRESLNVVVISVPGVDHGYEGGKCDLCFDATATADIASLVPAMMQKMEGTITDFLFAKIPLPSAHQYVETLIREIGFHLPVKKEKR